MTHARVIFEMKFERYEEVPPLEAAKIIENAKKYKRRRIIIYNIIKLSRLYQGVFLYNIFFT